MPEVTQESHQWAGRQAFDATGENVGKVGDIYLDRLSHRPAWALIHTGRLGTRKTFVPMLGATVDDDGVRLAFTQQQMSDAPKPAADGTLSPDDEQALYQHYAVEANRPPATGGIPQPASPNPVRRAPTDDQLPDEMIRSEEQLHVSTVFRPAEMVRIRKVVVTEEVTVTVSLRREEIRIEHLPVTAEVSDTDLAALSAQAAATQSAELVLLEEQPVVEKRVVPYERVRFSKQIVTEERQVTDQVRKERITTDHEPVADQ